MNLTQLHPRLAQVEGSRDMRLAAMEAASRRVPARWQRNANPTPPLYFVVGGTVLPSGQTIGLVRRSDTVAGSEMPAGTGGSSGDILPQPAFPFPSGLPNGIAIGQNVATLAYAFILCDARTTYASNVPMGHRLYCGANVILDKVVSGVTYRYICLLAVAAY